MEFYFLRGIRVLILIKDALDIFKWSSTVENLQIYVFQTDFLLDMALIAALCSRFKCVTFTKDFDVLKTLLLLLEVRRYFTQLLVRATLVVTLFMLNTAAATAHCIWRFMILLYLNLILTEGFQRGRNRLLSRLLKAIPGLYLSQDWLDFVQYAICTD